MDAQPASVRRSTAAGGGIELHLHQVRHQVHDVDLEALLEQAARGLQAEQAAADHRRPRDCWAYARDRLAVVERAEDEHAGLVSSPSPCSQALDRRHEGHAAGGDHERVVGLDDRRRRADAPCAARAVDRASTRHARVQRDAVLARTRRAG